MFSRPFKGCSREQTQVLEMALEAARARLRVRPRDAFHDGRSLPLFRSPAELRYREFQGLLG
jgi:hypothetical protein